MKIFKDIYYPICRSITGQGVRDTLARIEAEILLQRIEVASGMPVFDAG